MSASERRIAELEGEVTKLRHLLGRQMRTGESLEFEAIVTREGEPFVQLRWDQLAAQVSLAEAREMAMGLLRVAEWADVDAISLRSLQAAGFSEEEVAGFMAMMRETRGGTAEAAARA